MGEAADIALNYLNNTFHLDLNQRQLPSAQEFTELVKGKQIGSRHISAFCLAQKDKFNPRGRRQTRQQVQNIVDKDFSGNRRAYNLVKNFMAQVRIGDLDIKKNMSTNVSAINGMRLFITKTFGIEFAKSSSREEIKNRMLKCNDSTLKRFEEYDKKFGDFRNIEKPQRLMNALIKEVLAEKKKYLAKLKQKQEKGNEEINLDDLKNNAHKNFWEQTKSQNSRRRHNKGGGDYYDR
jgi:hypothetical protein